LLWICCFGFLSLMNSCMKAFRYRGRPCWPAQAENTGKGGEESSYLNPTVPCGSSPGFWSWGSWGLLRPEEGVPWPRRQEWSESLGQTWYKTCRDMCFLQVLCLFFPSSLSLFQLSSREKKSPGKENYLFIYLLWFFLGRNKVWTQALGLLGRHFTVWVISPALYFIFKFFLVGSGFELRASCLQSKCPTFRPRFALVILEMESQELFAWAGLKLWSSQS
jgi:hypothetical protein